MPRTPAPRAALERVTRTPASEYGAARLRLDKNENLAPDPALARALRARLTPGFLARYPDYGPATRGLARRLRRPAESFLWTAGSDGAIKLAFEAYVDRGDEVAVMDPSFAMYGVYAAVRGAKLAAVPFPKDLSNPTPGLLAAIGPRTRLVCVANPNNPTGTMLARGDLEALARRAARFGALLLIDEAYYYFTRHTFLPQARRHANVLVTRTFSKACGLAGLRLGFAHGAPEVIANLRKCQAIFEVNAVAAAAAEHLVSREGAAWRYAARVEAGKDYLARLADELGLGFRRGHANFVLLDLGSRAAAAARRLAAAGVRVGSGYRHPALRGALKVTAGPPDVLAPFAGALRRALA